MHGTLMLPLTKLPQGLACPELSRGKRDEHGSTRRLQNELPTASLPLAPSMRGKGTQGHRLGQLRGALGV